MALQRVLELQYHQLNLHLQVSGGQVGEGRTGVGSWSAVSQLEEVLDQTAPGVIRIHVRLRVETSKGIHNTSRTSWLH